MFFTMVKNHFQIRELIAEVHVFEYGGKAYDTFEKTCFKCFKTFMLNLP